jgi:hypothetical protein
MLWRTAIMRLKVDIDCGATGGRGGTSNPRLAGKSTISATLTSSLAVLRPSQLARMSHANGQQTTFSAKKDR